MTGSKQYVVADRLQTGRILSRMSKGEVLPCFRVWRLTRRRATDRQLAGAELEWVSPMSSQCLWYIFPGHLLIPLACLHVHPDRFVFREIHFLPRVISLTKQLLTAAYYTRTNREAKRVETLLRSFVYSSLQEQVWL